MDPTVSLYQTARRHGNPRSMSWRSVPLEGGADLPEVVQGLEGTRLVRIGFRRCYIFLGVADPLIERGNVYFGKWNGFLGEDRDFGGSNLGEATPYEEARVACGR